MFQLSTSIIFIEGVV